MTTFPKISIVTACFNQVGFIEEAISSITNQNYPNLEYIIVDGGSSDGTVDVIRKHESKISFWVSEKDGGLYNALNKGFQLATGEIFGWLNSDDILHRNSLFTIAEIFSNHANVNWLQGHPNVIDEAGRIVFHRKPRSSKYSFLVKQYHDGVFIQQESTYWRKKLWAKSGSTISQRFRFAGDFELWMRFFNHAELFVTDAFIGAFRVRTSGQLSQDNYAAYLEECDQIVDESINGLSTSDLKKLNRLRHIMKIRSVLPSRLNRLANFFTLKIEKQRNVVRYDFQQRKFLLK